MPRLSTFSQTLVIVCLLNFISIFIFKRTTILFCLVILYSQFSSAIYSGRVGSYGVVERVLNLGDLAFGLSLYLLLKWPRVQSLHFWASVSHYFKQDYSLTFWQWSKKIICKINLQIMEYGNLLPVPSLSLSFLLCLWCIFIK